MKNTIFQCSRLCVPKQCEVIFSCPRVVTPVPRLEPVRSSRLQGPRYCCATRSKVKTTSLSFHATNHHLSRKVIYKELFTARGGEDMGKTVGLAVSQVSGKCQDPLSTSYPVKSGSSSVPFRIWRPKTGSKQGRHADIDSLILARDPVLLALGGRDECMY